MSDFLESFGNLITSKFENRARFAELAGASTPYLSEIFNKGKLPTVEKLTEWLQKADVGRDDTKKLVYLLSLAKTKEYPDLLPFLDGIEKREKEVTALLKSLVELCRKNGVKIPQDLIERVQTL
jgi:transcriptional regulator with XRE-family HTH domain